jgi:diadenosine tetraphosphatase ApaH/serine/threonine PP2A family protein phosphatase
VAIAVIADIHGNLPALQAVVADAGEVEAWWCLGDITGYGADPNGCVQLVRELGAVVLPGNHDLGAVGLEDLRRFNDHAARCLRWTAQTLEEGPRQTLLDAATRPVRVERERYTLVHASLRDPIWEYVDTPGRARANFFHLETQFCLVGHTHVPAAHDERGTNRIGTAVGADTLAGGRLLANPGAVGQPRDEDWRASYLLIDDERQQWQWRRVTYDVVEAARRIRRAGLPDVEAARLALGR